MRWLHFRFLDLFYLPIDLWAGFWVALWTTLAFRAKREGNHIMRRKAATRALNLLFSPMVRDTLAARLRVLRRMKKRGDIITALYRYDDTLVILDQLAD